MGNVLPNLTFKLQAALSSQKMRDGGVVPCVVVAPGATLSNPKSMTVVAHTHHGLPIPCPLWKLLFKGNLCVPEYLHITGNVLLSGYLMGLMSYVGIMWPSMEEFPYI